jgi:hypothetical protein
MHLVLVRVKNKIIQSKTIQTKSQLKISLEIMLMQTLCHKNRLMIVCISYVSQENLIL